MSHKLFISLILVAILSSTLTYLYITNKFSKPSPYSLNTVNSRGFAASDDLYQYASFQIKYPSSYLVTSDDMVVDYQTQGGMAPPRLILAQKQLLDTDYYSELQRMNQTNENCILVWETQGYSSSEDWRQNIVYNSKEVTVVSEEKIKAKNFDINLYKITVDGQEKFDAFLDLPKDFSYYFNTCGNKNKADFETVLKNFDLRGIIE